MRPLDEQVLRAGLDWQARGLAPVLVTVARTWGSSPRPPGSLMALAADGQVVGSVSGGCIEDDLIQRLRQQGPAGLCPEGRPARLSYGVSAEQARRFGLPCGGTVELVLEPVGRQSRLADLLAALEQRRLTRRVLHLGTGAVELASVDHEGPTLVEDERLITHVGPVLRLIVIGAGDVSRFLCEMAVGLGFAVVVCDPRLDTLAAWALPGVDFSREMPDDLVLRLRPDRRCAVVALAHDPKLDDLALIDALRSQAFYVGAIGSRHNAALRGQRLQQHFGLTDDELARLHGPAGLDIGSRVPAEIALSIMAEVVAAKNGIATPPLNIQPTKGFHDPTLDQRAADARRSHAGHPAAVGAAR